jgi:hypothetical protein
MELIESERRRQVAEEGHTSERDDMYIDGELAKAARHFEVFDRETPSTRSWGWPWPSITFKPLARLDNLVRAGALYLAEAARLERCAVRGTGPAVTIDGSIRREVTPPATAASLANIAHANAERVASEIDREISDKL